MRCIVGEKRTAMALAVAAMLAAIAVRGSMAASPPSSLPCMSQLTACLTIINFINPPASCCMPLMDAFENHLRCLCYVFDNPDVFGTVKIDVKEFMSLFTNCRITDSSTMCHSTTIYPPPANPNSSNPGHGTMWIGTSGFMFLLLSWWSFMA